MSGCINSGFSDHQYILPITTITLRRGSKSVHVRCLVDTGSQNSYFCGGILRDLHCEPRSVRSVQMEIVTFLGKKYCRLQQITTVVQFASGLERQLPILVNENLELHHKVKHLPVIVDNLEALNYTLDTDLGRNTDLKLGGLIGIDLFKFVKHI